MNTPLLDHILHLADDALILGHRNSEWCGHGPVLEQDIAITNISLDLIGQARNFYQYAATLKGGDTTEDSFAYFRDSEGFRNSLLVELPKGDWAVTTLRQFLFSVYQQLLFIELKGSDEHQVAAIAEKSLKEIAYHLRWSSEWVIRLGDGTEESHQRLAIAIDQLWPYTHELFVAAPYEEALKAEGITVNFEALKSNWLTEVKKIMEEAGCSLPSTSAIHVGGKEGRHTHHLNEILGELQSVARAHPGATW